MTPEQSPRFAAEEPSPAARQEPTIVRASLDDVPAVASLLGVLFAQEAGFAPERALQERAVRGILADPAQGFILERARRCRSPRGWPQSSGW